MVVLLGAHLVAEQVAATAALRLALCVALQVAPPAMVLVVASAQAIQAAVAVAVLVVWALEAVEAVGADTVEAHQDSMVVASHVGM